MLTLVVGLAIGVLTSVLGVGGGFLLVPALVLVSRVPIRLAVGTSLVVIAVNAAVSIASNAFHSPESLEAASASAVAVIGGFGIAGSFVGARLRRRLPALLLRRAFAAMLVIVAVSVVVKSLRA